MIVLVILLLLIIIVDQFHISSLYKDINILYDGLEEIDNAIKETFKEDEININ